MEEQPQEFFDFYVMDYQQHIRHLALLNLMYSLIEEKPFGSRAGDNWNRRQML